MDGGEALKLRGEVVDADAYRHPEDAALISHGFEPVPRGFEDRRYRDAGQHAARGISDRAGQGRFLRERCDRQGQDCAEQKQPSDDTHFHGTSWITAHFVLFTAHFLLISPAP